MTELPAVSMPRRGLGLDHLFAGAIGLLGLGLGARPIADNSFFVHLRTGLDIAAGQGIPRRDPYSATASGARWVVQSWLPELAYGAVHKVAGDGGLLVLMAVTTATLGLLVARLARSSSPLRSVGAALLALGVGSTGWSPRPLLFGLGCLALTILVVTAGRRPWLLVPIAWVWVNSHGSFPLGAAWLAAAAFGAGCDVLVVRRANDRGEADRAAASHAASDVGAGDVVASDVGAGDVGASDVGAGTNAGISGWPAAEVAALATRAKALGWFVVGLTVGCVNPLGPRLLLFPLTIGSRHKIFQAILEWQSPRFQSTDGLVTAAAIVLSVLVLSRRRTPLAVALPAVCFIGLALVAQRNLAPAGIVLAPALGAALALPARATDNPHRTRLSARKARIAVALLGVSATIILAHAASSPALDLREYPVHLIDEGERTGVLAKGRLFAAPDVVGCYLVLRRGRGAGVFVDDRYDMYPVAVGDDVLALVHAGDGALGVLDRRHIDVILWERGRPLTALLTAKGWREVLGDRSWTVLQRP